MGTIKERSIRGNFPSTFHTNGNKNMDAMANRKKAAENGNTSLATILPAINVPPQKTAVSMSLRYINITGDSYHGKSWEEEVPGSPFRP